MLRPQSYVDPDVIAKAVEGDYSSSNEFFARLDKELAVTMLKYTMIALPSFLQCPSRFATF